MCSEEKYFMNGGSDGVNELVNLVLDERAWERDTGKVNISCHSEGCFYV